MLLAIVLWLYLAALAADSRNTLLFLWRRKLHLKRNGIDKADLSTKSTARDLSCTALTKSATMRISDALSTDIDRYRCSSHIDFRRCIAYCKTTPTVFYIVNPLTEALHFILTANSAQFFLLSRYVQEQAVREAATICPRPLWPWPFDLESDVRVTCDVGYLCANFALTSLCSRLRPDVRDRRQTSDVKQTDVRQHHRLMPRLGGGA